MTVAKSVTFLCFLLYSITIISYKLRAIISRMKKNDYEKSLSFAELLLLLVPSLIIHPSRCLIRLPCSNYEMWDWSLNFLLVIFSLLTYLPIISSHHAMHATWICGCAFIFCFFSSAPSTWETLKQYMVSSVACVQKKRTRKLRGKKTSKNYQQIWSLSYERLFVDRHHGK